MAQATIWGLVFAAGASSFAGVLQLLVWIRQPSQRMHLWFALFAFMFSVSALQAVGVCQAESMEEAVFHLKWRISAMIAGGIFSLAFIASFTRIFQKIPFFIFLSLFVLFLLVNAWAPFSIRHTAVIELKEVILPWGEPISMVTGTVHPLRVPLLLTALAYRLYIGWLAVLQYRRGERVRAVVLLVGTFVDFAFSCVAYTISLREESFSFLGEFSVFFWIVAMSVFLSEELRGRTMALESANRELHESEERFSKLAENIPEVFWMCAPDFNKFYYVSPAYETVWGRSIAEVYENADAWLDLVHPDDRGRLIDAKNRAKPFDKSVITLPEYRIVRRDGEIRQMVTRGFPIMDEEGQVVRIAGIAVDITDRREAQERLDEMEAHVVHAGRLSILGEMVAGIAHEINQPLYSIVNFAKACRNVLSRNEELDRKELVEWNNEISDAASRATEIIKRLRRFSRRGSVEFAKVDANQLIDESIELMGFELRRHRVGIRREFGADLGPVHVNRVEIQQVLVNLLQNACEAMDETDRAVRQIVVRSRLAEEGIKISIADRGPGLPEEDELNVFAPFVTTKKDGLGLGLAISATIVDAHGGKLWATRNEGGGATFHLLLPTVGETFHRVG